MVVEGVVDKPVAGFIAALARDPRSSFHNRDDFLMPLSVMPISLASWVRVIRGLADISNVIEMGKLLLIGKDKSTYILMDKQGKPIGKEEFKGINTKILQSPSVTSDYFNYDSVVQDLLSGLKSNGIGKYTLNMPVTQLGIADYDSYTYSYTYRDPGQRESHWKYSVETSVYTNNPIAVREYSGYNSKVIANPEAKVETITKAVNADVDCWKKIRDKIIAKLESEGFKKDEETDDTIIFTGKNCHLTVDANSSGKYISLKMTAL